MFVFHYMYVLNVPIQIVTDVKEMSGRWDVNSPCQEEKRKQNIYCTEDL